MAVPVCPFCNHLLSRSQVGALYNSLRVSRSGGGRRPTGNRRKPRAYEAMPIIMELLRGSADSPLRTSAIHEHVHDRLSAGRGYEDKPMATGWGLKYLQHEGLVLNIRHGYWVITEKGLTKPMTEEVGMEITAKIERKKG